ncbi:MAG: sigma-70 family RNA polymerase sigma factor [Proteobacteria bacterium]|nr:sigma-70 family RNA polymerase sigma factor [Pseudomonadota bacterium]
MRGSANSGEPAASPPGVFATTHWSVVLAAGDPSSPTARSALEALCRTYGYPLYEREWAMTLLDRARSRLRREYVAAAKADLYRQLQDFPLSGKGERSFQEVAAELGLTEGALKSAVHRLRARYRELLRQL